MFELRSKKRCNMCPDAVNNAIKQTDATLLANINSQHCLELLRPFARSKKFGSF